MVSAVPAGLVIARDDVFGTMTPSAATIGTTTIVVRWPGTPPMQCLSAIGPGPKSRREPAAIMARVKSTSSSQVERAQRAGEDEHRELDLRVAVLHDVGEDGVEGRHGRAAVPAVCRAPGRRCVGAGAIVALTGAPGGQPEIGEGVVRQADLVRCDELVRGRS